MTPQQHASALYRAMEAGHERAAGEWQIEWQVVPQLACLGAGCVGMAAEVAEGLVVSVDAMRRNLRADNGLIMAEAYMIRLAPSLGHKQAHGVVYEAAVKEGRRINDWRRRWKKSFPAKCGRSWKGKGH